MTVLVAGGTGGIGFQLALALSEPNETVVLGYGKDDEVAAKACEHLAAQGSRPVAVKADLGTEAGVEQLIAAVPGTGEELRHVVHSVVEAVTTPLLLAEPDVVAHALAANGISLLWLVRGARPFLGRGSTVLYVTSEGSRVVSKRYGLVGPAKSLGEAYVRYLAVELAPSGIRINAIAPGLQETSAMRAYLGAGWKDLLVRAEAKNPSGRLITPRDYTGLVRFLASAEAEMITGQVISVQGGADLLI